MLLRRRFKFQYILIALPLLVLYNEFLIHRMQPWFWRALDCEEGDAGCTKILLIADPQLQGEAAVSPPLSYLLNWDSDRYVKHTFATAMNYFNPDILIYLGDLTDEGSISTKEQFHRYMKRLMHIFDTNQPVMQVWIPGDNDIGGENERVHMDKVREFEATFDQPDVLEFQNNIVVYKLNRITHTMPKIPPHHIPREENFNIIVSHFPVLSTGLFAQKAINEINPDIIFSGHDHIAKYVESPKGSLYAKTVKRMSPGDSSLVINFDNTTNYEIFVPTCSYRMGVANMGYGAAVLEHHNKRLRYEVLWSTGRFPVLYFYLYTLLLGVICFTIYYGFCKVSCRRRF